MEVSTANNQELWSFLRDKVMTFEGIRDVETLSILKAHKLHYTSPATG